MTPSYGLFVAGGVSAATIVAYALSPRLKMDRNKLLDVVFWAMIGGIVGARLLFIIVEWRYFAALCNDPGSILPVGVPCTATTDCYPGQECVGSWCENVGDCWAALKFWQGGWVFLGGVLGAVPAILVAARVQRVSAAKVFALLSTGLPLGHVFGRLGCFVKGCCYGHTTSHGWTINGMIPVQLIEAGGEAVIFGLMVARFLRLFPRDGKSPSAGAIAATPWVFLLLYSPLRFFTELLRGDTHRGFFFQTPWPAFAKAIGISPRTPIFLSTSQGLVLGLFLLALVALVLHSAIARKSNHPGKGAQDERRA